MTLLLPKRLFFAKTEVESAIFKFYLTSVVENFQLTQHNQIKTKRYVF